MLSSKKQNMSGFTLIELLTTLAINVVVFGALITIFLSVTNHYRETAEANMLNQQMQTAMTIMTNEIRRAGYWGNAQSDIGSASNNNPFIASGVDLQTGASNTCILFSYDRDDNGSIPAVSSSSDDERYGFRLVNNTLQTRPPGAPLSCTAATNTWEAMTDATKIQVTALTFTINTTVTAIGPGAKNLVQRSVDISMTARLTNDTSVTRTMTQRIRVMNDVFTDE